MNDFSEKLHQHFDGKVVRKDLVQRIKKGTNVPTFVLEFLLARYCASNEPTGLDRALRNRMQFRLDIAGPETSPDFSDMFMILTKKLREQNRVRVKEGYQPFATQDNFDYERGIWVASGALDATAIRVPSKKLKTVRDFGDLLYELKQENPSISGRSMKAIMEAAGGL